MLFLLIYQMNFIACFSLSNFFSSFFFHLRLRRMTFEVAKDEIEGRKSVCHRRMNGEKNEIHFHFDYCHFGIIRTSLAWICFCHVDAKCAFLSSAKQRGRWKNEKEEKIEYYWSDGAICFTTKRQLIFFSFLFLASFFFISFSKIENCFLFTLRSSQ